MLVDPASGYLPVGLLDDDPAKRPLRICGVPVCGAGADVVARTGATPLVIAVLREAIRSMGTYLSVRFGNVLGSRGSVLTTFTEQLAQGGPTTVTHPEVTRFFLTIPEAVQLVIQAAVIGRSGEALVLDMGAPVRIADIARQLMEMSGKSAPIVYTGLLEGEKLHEDLFGSGELDRRPLHAAISHVIVPPLDPVRLWSVALVRAEVAALSECAALQAVATTPVPVEPADRCDANATS
jgi:FlaA1/EpsC-like NDP-sugar epimerase